MKYTDEVKRELLKCVKAALNGQPVCDAPAEELLALANSQGLAHLVGDSDSAMKAVLRTQTRLKALVAIKDCFNKEEIPYIILKGAKICELYPENWMRTSSDLDLLIKAEDEKRANDALLNNLKAEFLEKNEHHIGYILEKFHIELHFTLFSDEDFDAYKNAKRVNEQGFEYELIPNSLCEYLLKHMKKHFMSGGCGLRPMTDIYLVSRKYDVDCESLAGLDLFNKKVFEFIKHFDNPDLPFSDFDQLVFENGIHGTKASVASAAIAKHGTGINYALKHVFVDYNSMLHMYPWLKGKKYLLPYAWARYGLNRLFGGHLSNLNEKLNVKDAIDEDNLELTKKVFKELEII